MRAYECLGPWTCTRYQQGDGEKGDEDESGGDTKLEMAIVIRT